ncbi:MAG: AIPR family protein [Cyclobacteriaceae bacterium]|nr:AIPR family protein [Cyclobacteriaceae bacterium]
MSSITLKRIEKVITERYLPKIRVTHPDLTSIDQLISAGQICLAIASTCEVDSETAVHAITDGFKDNGIDAILLDEDSKLLTLAQGKWIKNGQGSPKKSEITAFFNGVEDLVSCRFNKFNDKVKSKRDNVIKAVESASYRIQLLLIYSGVQPLGNESKDLIRDKLALLNDGFEIYTARVINLKDLYQCIISATDGAPIDLTDITLTNWGKHSEPYESIYGEMSVVDLGELWKTYKNNLLTKNLRRFKGDTTVNAYIKLTLMKEPRDFWYFNNGITILCKSFGKGPKKDREAGVFSFKDVNIVNGAQTYGAIGETYLQYRDQIKDAKVHVRFIDLKGAPDDYASKITKFNNTQNKIENKDFASLDSNQTRLKQELFLDGIEYSFKTGEQKPHEEAGCTLEEATIALGCAHYDIDLAILVSREIGKIWEDIERQPYTRIFNDKTSGDRLWNCVRIYRLTRDFLKEKEVDTGDGENPALAIFAKRLILHKVFKYFGYKRLSMHNLHLTPKTILPVCEKVFNSTKEVTRSNKGFRSPYSFFKTPKNVRKLSESIDVSLGLSNVLFPDET